MKIFKYQPINRNSIAGLSQAKLWVSEPTSFNDPFEFRLKRSSTQKGLDKIHRTDIHLNEEFLEGFISAFEKKISKMGVVCFSKSCDNILMWSHYSDGHKGMCLEFELDSKQTLSDKAIYQVNYSLEYPEINLENNIWSIDGAAKILYTKSKEWEYEQELRLIRESGNELIDYPIKLSSIIFGLKTPENEIDMIKKILKGQDIHYKKVRLADNNYKLEINGL